MTSSRMCMRGPTHVFLCLYLLQVVLEHAHLGTNSPHIDVAYVAPANIDEKYIAAKCSWILLKFRSDMSHINSSDVIIIN